MFAFRVSGFRGLKRQVGFFSEVFWVHGHRTNRGPFLGPIESVRHPYMKKHGRRDSKLDLYRGPRKTARHNASRAGRLFL